MHPHDTIYALRVSHLFAPRYYKILNVTPDVSFTAHLSCPADGGTLTTLCTLVGREGAQRMRIGCCDACGYIGYVDRPSREWLSHYYSDVWDYASQENVGLEAEVEKLKARKGALGEIGAAVERLPIDKNRFVLEIGGGTDRLPKALREIGYTNIVTVDPSRYRAEIVRRAYGINVLPFPFEHENAQAELRKRAPFSFICSSHVLEHTYDPAEIIELCAGLQGEGDYIILALPNVKNEVPGQIIFFLPHLHGFSDLSLGRLLERFGYHVIEQSPPGGNNFIVAQKRGTKDEKEYAQRDHANYFETTLDRFVTALGLNQTYSQKFRLLWWFKKTWPLGRQERAWSSFAPIVWLQYYFYSKIYFRHVYKKEFISSMGEAQFKRKAAHFTSINGCLVRDVVKRYTTVSESPLEIQFDGNIKLFCK
jgi:2-polyprenyl-3-methyl-5-hydroxy-6-metoxy-1,4-benzoquinol methylase